MPEPTRWTIRRLMVSVALLTPPLAVARSPFACGFVAALETLALFVGLSLWRGRYGRVAGLVIGYPLLPLLILYLTRGVILLRLARRSSVGFLDGLLGISDVAAVGCLFAYVACVSAWVGGLKRPDKPALTAAAKRVVLWMPPAWIGLFVFALWDPFGVLGYFFR